MLTSAVTDWLAMLRDHVTSSNTSKTVYEEDSQSPLFTLTQTLLAHLSLVAQCARPAKQPTSLTDQQLPKVQYDSDAQADVSENTDLGGYESQTGCVYRNFLKT